MIISILTYLKSKERFIAVFIAGALFFSCHQEKPANVLSHQEMTRAIMNLYIVEQKVSDLKLRQDSSRIVFEKLKKKIFERDSLQDSTFKKSFDYYLERPKELELIYTAVVDSLNLLQQKLIVKDTTKTDTLKTDTLKGDTLKAIETIKTDLTKTLK